MYQNLNQAISRKTALETSEALEYLPEGFVYLSEVAPTIQQDIRYTTENNFVGYPIDGYEAPVSILSLPAAQAMAAVQQEILALGLSLKIFDSYRPQRAVNHFIRWAQDASDQKTKSEYYPHLSKAALFDQGYLAKQSSHSRGSAADLTIVSTRKLTLVSALQIGPFLPNGELDMGSPFDFFDECSNTDYPNLPENIKYNRRWLHTLMAKHGFDNLPTEWWHYTLRDEPYPDRAFDFPVR